MPTRFESRPPGCYIPPSWYFRTQEGRLIMTSLRRSRRSSRTRGTSTMTLDATTQDLINDVVTEFIEQGRMFTAFEVSLAVKDRGAPYRHRNMRDYVHEVVFRVGGDRGTYTRTLMDVGAPEQAWVYHPLTSNPYEYVPLDRRD